MYINYDFNWHITQNYHTTSTGGWWASWLIAITLQLLRQVLRFVAFRSHSAACTAPLEQKLPPPSLASAAQQWRVALKTSHLQGKASEKEAESLILETNKITWHDFMIVTLKMLMQLIMPLHFLLICTEDCDYCVHSWRAAAGCVRDEDGKYYWDYRVTSQCALCSYK